LQDHFRVETRIRRDGAAVVAVAGELDLASSPRLEEELERVGETDAGLLILDLRDLEFMDSTGLSLLVKAHQRASDAGRRFGLVNGGPQVQRLLSLTGLTDRLTVVDSPEELLG
jgi:anti-sigma B factor antagonist